MSDRIRDCLTRTVRFFRRAAAALADISRRADGPEHRRGSPKIDVSGQNPRCGGGPGATLVFVGTSTGWAMWMLAVITYAAFMFALWVPGVFGGMLLGKLVRLHATGE